MLTDYPGHSWTPALRLMMTIVGPLTPIPRTRPSLGNQLSINCPPKPEARGLGGGGEGGGGSPSLPSPRSVHFHSDFRPIRNYHMGSVRSCGGHVPSYRTLPQDHKERPQGETTRRDHGLRIQDPVNHPPARETTRGDHKGRPQGETTRGGHGLRIQDPVNHPPARETTRGDHKRRPQGKTTR